MKRFLKAAAAFAAVCVLVLAALWLYAFHGYRLKSGDDLKVLFPGATNVIAPHQGTMTVLVPGWGRPSEVLGAVEENGRLVVGYRTVWNFLDQVITHSADLTRADACLFPPHPGPVVFRSVQWSIPTGTLTWSREIRQH